MSPIVAPVSLLLASALWYIAGSVLQDQPSFIRALIWMAGGVSFAIGILVMLFYGAAPIFT